MEVIAQDNEQYFGRAGVDAMYGAIDGDSEEYDPEEDIIHVSDVRKTYLLGIEGVPALRGVSLSVKRGETVIIFGTSGGGKTTLLNILGTIDRPTKGHVKICGVTVKHNTPDAVLSAIRLNHVGFVFQTFNLLGSLSAVENVELPMIMLGKASAKERRERATDLLDQVGLLDRMHHYPSMLSGGEQQRVTIARAVANNPDLLLLDEPTGDLDTTSGKRVLQQLMDLNNDGITLIMVTHDVGLKPLAHRVIWLRDGKIQRVEVNSAEKRQRALDELQADYDHIMAEINEEAATSTDDGGEAGFRKTEVRMPAHYRTVRNIKSVKGRRELNRRSEGLADRDTGGRPSTSGVRTGRPKGAGSASAVRADPPVQRATASSTAAKGKAKDADNSWSSSSYEYSDDEGDAPRDGAFLKA